METQHHAQNIPLYSKNGRLMQYVCEEQISNGGYRVVRDRRGLIRRAYMDEEFHSMPIRVRGSGNASVAACAVSRHQAEREHRENEAAGVHSESEWQAVLDKFGRKCLRCGIPESETRFKKLTKDHIVPLASGGTQYASNLQPLCSSCNSWKHNREIDFRPVLA